MAAIVRNGCQNILSNVVSITKIVLCALLYVFLVIFFLSVIFSTLVAYVIVLYNAFTIMFFTFVLAIIID